MRRRWWGACEKKKWKNRKMKRKETLVRMREEKERHEKKE